MPLHVLTLHLLAKSKGWLCLTNRSERRKRLSRHLSHPQGQGSVCDGGERARSLEPDTKRSSGYSNGIRARGQKQIRHLLHASDECQQVPDSTVLFLILVLQFWVNHVMGFIGFLFRFLGWDCGWWDIKMQLLYCFALCLFLFPTRPPRPPHPPLFPSLLFLLVFVLSVCDPFHLQNRPDMT